MTAHPLQPMLRPTAHAVRLLAALAVAATPIAHAALTGIADEPLITQSEFKPAPNLMVILDDSGSMIRSYMPDDLGSDRDITDTATSGGKTTWLGFKSAQCNGLAYDPGYAYVPPVTSTSSAYVDARFDGVYSDGFSTGSTTNLNSASNGFLKVAISSGTIGTGSKNLTISSRTAATLGAKSFVLGDEITMKNSASKTFTGKVTAWSSTGSGQGNLTINITSMGSSTNTTGDWTVTFPGQVYYTYNGKNGVKQPAMGWKYSAAGDVNTTTDFYKQCAVADSTDSSTNTDAGVFELNVVSANSSAAEKTNYANWHSFYRRRELLMRTAMGRALAPWGSTYRVGFMQINKTADVSGPSKLSFRPVSDFDTTQKNGFYKSLYEAPRSIYTPLRLALSTAGRYYAKKLPNQQTDPMQYACQRNFALLATDGYWNDSSSNAESLPGKDLSNANIGNADGSAAAPYKDSYPGTLADVAYYYYTTDLRNGTPGSAACTGAPVGNNPGQDVCKDIVPPAGKDTAKHQHMTTFTIGMGVTGTKTFTTDEAELNQIDWPKPVGNKITTVDDLWHAAINGRGAHYSAQNASELSAAIQGITTAIQDVSGAGSATSTSTLDLVPGDGNIAFEASYTTGSWFGDVVAREIDSRTALPKKDAADKDLPPKWSARAKLDAKSVSSRTIYFKRGTDTTLREFTWANLPSTLQAHFKDACAAPAKLTQCAALSTVNQTTVNDGAELVAYLRGDRTKEAKSTNTTAPLFRERKSVLGDIINSKPIHVGKPPFSYSEGSDPGYATFKTNQANRKKVVYVGANDGMLHALYAGAAPDTAGNKPGDELWAYVPTTVMPNLYKLADTRYGSTGKPHTYFVDGKTVQGDVKIGSDWKTILVGGLNKGGRAYYALDITDPDVPKPLWEFTDNNLGLTYSDPIITKLADGTWVVAFGSGYNNVSPGDGKGRLFVVNAATGAVLRDIATTEGTTTTPAGLSKINVWVKALNDNTAERFYAGDLLGNVWRFDVDGKVLPKNSALLLAQMEDASGKAQPITTEPKLREYDKKPIVVVATGQYLDRPDIENTDTQSIAAIRDPLTATGWGVVRPSSGNTNKFKKITISKSGKTASGAAVTVDWATDSGWWADFPTGGERVSMPMEWDGARLLAATTIPDGNQCKSGGASWLYAFGLANGTTNGEEFSADALIVGFSVVRNDVGDPKIIVRTSDNQTEVKDGSGLGGGTTVKRARRVSWRELN